MAGMKMSNQMREVVDSFLPEDETTPKTSPVNTGKASPRPFADAAMLGVFPEGGRGTESVFYIDVPTDLPTYHNTPRSPRKGKWDECIFYFLLMGICWMGWLIMICAFLMWTVMGNNLMDSYFGVDRNATSWRYAETPEVPASEDYPSEPGFYPDSPQTYPGDSFDPPQVPVTPRFPEPTVGQYRQAPARGHVRPQRKVRSGT